MEFNDPRCTIMAQSMIEPGVPRYSLLSASIVVPLECGHFSDYRKDQVRYAGSDKVLA